MAYGEENATVRIRAKALYWATVAGALFYALMLWNLQIVRVREFRGKSEKNAVRVQPVKAGRGLILDRNGRILARNRRSFDLLIDPEDLSDAERDRVLEALRNLLGVDTGELAQRIDAAGRAKRPVLAAEDVEFRHVAWAEAHRLEYPHLRVRPAHRREYPGGSTGAHLIGYIGEITQRELDREDLIEHHRGDLVGKSGIEQYYNRILMGTHGRQHSVVNAVGYEMESWIEQDPVIGSTIQLTLDSRLQSAIEDSMGENAGAAVVVDVHSGAILALVSRPGFDPNLFSRRLTREQWRFLSEAPDNPLHNRATLSRYSPGSTFKILLALAALEEKRITPSTTFHCTGGTRIHGQYRRCWKSGGHGTVDLKRAIQGSCNVYFYKVGDLLGIEKMSEWAQAFGFGAVSGLDIPVESSGIVPNEAWKRKTYGEPWYPGETISVAIGQGALEVTPLQQAVFAAAVANSGTVYRPYVLESVHDPARPERDLETQPTVLRRVTVSREHLEVVREAMWMVVNQPGGTARSARVAELDVCGKTGTAQVHAGSAGKDNEEMAYELRDHAWFIGFAPRDDPQIAWAVFVEHGGHGGETAAPVAKQIVHSWFSDPEGPHPMSGQQAQRLPEGR